MGRGGHPAIFGERGLPQGSVQCRFDDIELYLATSSAVELYSVGRLQNSLSMGLPQPTNVPYGLEFFLPFTVCATGVVISGSSSFE